MGLHNQAFEQQQNSLWLCPKNLNSGQAADLAESLLGLGPNSSLLATSSL